MAGDKRTEKLYALFDKAGEVLTELQFAIKQLANEAWDKGGEAEDVKLTLTQLDDALDAVSEDGDVYELIGEIEEALMGSDDNG